MAENQELFGISRFFENENAAPEEAPPQEDGSSSEAALPAVGATYVNLVADQGPSCLIDAMAQLRMSPYLDSAGMSSCATQQLLQLTRIVEETDDCAREALCRKACRKVFRKPVRQAGTAKSIRSNALGESFSEPKALNVPDRLDQLDTLQVAKDAEQKQKDDRKRQTDLKAASELFILQTFKDLGYTAKDKKAITVDQLKLFCRNNDVVVAATPGKAKGRDDWIRAVQLAIGTENVEGFVNHDKSNRIVLVIPAGYETHATVSPDLAEGTDTTQDVEDAAGVVAVMSQVVESTVENPAASTAFNWVNEHPSEIV